MPCPGAVPSGRLSGISAILDSGWTRQGNAPLRPELDSLRLFMADPPRSGSPETAGLSLSEPPGQTGSI